MVDKFLQRQYKSSCISLKLLTKQKKEPPQNAQKEQKTTATDGTCR